MLDRKNYLQQLHDFIADNDDEGLKKLLIQNGVDYPSQDLVFQIMKRKIICNCSLFNELDQRKARLWLKMRGYTENVNAY